VGAAERLAPALSFFVVPFHHIIKETFMKNQETPVKNPHEGHRKRLRERYARSGMDDFADHEVMELLLTYAIPRIDVNDQAHALIDRFGSVAGALDALPEELCEVKGIGPEAAGFLTMLPAVFRRYAMNKVTPMKSMDTLVKIGEYLMALYTGVTFERVYLLLLNNCRCDFLDRAS
jgi:DNA repair protein RadC